VALWWEHKASRVTCDEREGVGEVSERKDCGLETVCAGRERGRENQCETEIEYIGTHRTSRVSQHRLHLAVVRSLALNFGSRCMLSVCARNRTEPVRSYSARGSTRQIHRRLQLIHCVNSRTIVCVMPRLI